jgi:hypothetical protein
MHSMPAAGSAHALLQDAAGNGGTVSVGAVFVLTLLMAGASGRGQGAYTRSLLSST